MTIKISKQLATMQDLAIGSGQVVQRRNGVDLTLDKIDLITASKLASENAGEGAALVSMEGGPTVEVAVLDRVIRVTNIAAMQALTVPVGTAVQTLGFSSAGDGGGSLYRIVATSAAVTDTVLLVLLTNGNRASLINGTIIINLEVNIPSQFADLQSAFNSVYSRLTIRNAVKVTLNVETGYEIDTGFLVKNADASAYEITSDDAVVDVAFDFVGMTGVTSIGESENGLFVGFNAKYPTISLLVDMGNFGGPGYFLTEKSTGNVSSACGVDNAGTTGLILDTGSQANAAGAFFRGSNTGNRVTTGSMLNAPGIKLSGMRTVPGGGASLDVSRGSFVNIAVPGGGPGSSDLSGSAERGLAARRSWVSADGVNCNNCASTGIRAESGSIVSATDCDADDSGADAFAALSGSTLNINGALGRRAASSGLLALDGSTVNARDADLSNAAGKGIICQSGANVNFRSGDARINGSTEQSNDMEVTRGGQIAGNLCLGGANVAFNTITSAGIIFK